jgi:hypothetical protein
MDVWERNSALNQQGFDSLLGSLLGIKAQIFQIHAREFRLRPS